MRICHAVSRSVLALAVLALLSCQSAGGPPGNSPQSSPQEETPWAGPPEMRPSPVHRPAGARRSTLEFRLVLDPPAPGAAELVDAAGTRLLVSADPVVTQQDITRVEVGRESFLPDQDFYIVYVHFTAEAANRLRDFSSQNLGRRLALVLDGELLLAPVLLTPFDSPVMIQGRYTRADALQIAGRLAP